MAPNAFSFPYNFHEGLRGRCSEWETNCVGHDAYSYLVGAHDKMQPQRQSLPFLLGSVLDASWSSFESLDSGTSSLLTDKKLQFILELRAGFWWEKQRVESTPSTGLGIHQVPRLGLGLINLWLLLPV